MTGMRFRRYRTPSSTRYANINMRVLFQVFFISPRIHPNCKDHPSHLVGDIEWVETHINCLSAVFMGHSHHKGDRDDSEKDFLYGPWGPCCPLEVDSRVSGKSRIACVVTYARSSIAMGKALCNPTRGIVDLPANAGDGVGSTNSFVAITISAQGRQACHDITSAGGVHGASTLAAK